jgi:hypothetical protein
MFELAIVHNRCNTADAHTASMLVVVPNGALAVQQLLKAAHTSKVGTVLILRMNTH